MAQVMALAALLLLLELFLLDVFYCNDHPDADDWRSGMTDIGIFIVIINFYICVAECKTTSNFSACTST